MSTTKRQAAVLFFIAPIGVLACGAHIEESKYLLAAMFAAITLGAIALGIWLWRRPLDEDF